MSSSDVAEDAKTYADLFPRVYLAFHRRDEPGGELSRASRAVLLHLANTGPVSVGELAKHLRRTQSVASEIVDQLEGHGLLARLRDQSDRRKVLVWLTDSGRERLVDDQRVLSPALLVAALTHMDPGQRQRLIKSTEALIAAAKAVAFKRRK